jgi:Secretion system C-terminal sorting domain
MNRLNITFFFIALYLIPLVSVCQNPGGISTNLTLWLKGNYSTGPARMTFSSSNLASGWRNEKSTYTLTQATTTKQPLWYNGSPSSVVTGSSDSLNYNPNVKFNYSATVANASLLANSNTSTDLLGTAGTIIMVLNDDNAFRTAFTYYSDNLYRYQIKQTFRSQTSDGVIIASPLTASYGYTSDFSAATYNSRFANNARIVVSRGFGTTLTVRRNGTSMGLTNNYVLGFTPGIIAGINLGGNPGVTNNEPYNGRFGEVITYNTTLSDATIRSIESYLAVKYGITLNPSGLDATNGYVNSSGTSIYSQGSNGTTYWNTIGGVIGLGRDDNSGLTQKQSHTYDDSVRLYISSLVANNPANTGTIANNNDFLMMGGTNGKLMEDAATTAEKPSGVSVRLDREWKLINTSFDQSFSMQIKLNGGANNNFTGGGTLQLLADDDGNFSNATIITSGSSGVTISYSSGIITVTIDPASSGGIFPVNGTPKFITVGALSSTLPDDEINFVCSKTSSSIISQWKPVTELQTERYELEKTFDLINWSTVAVKQVQSFTGEMYQYTDVPSRQTVYYRVKVVSKTGAIRFTGVRKISTDQNKISVNVFPNPVTSVLNLTWNGIKKPKYISVVSADGRSFTVPFTIHDSKATVQTDALPKGIYIAAIANDEETVYIKFAKN